MKNHVSGFFISTFIHLGLISLILAGATMVQPPIKQDQAIPLRLSMFQPSLPPPVKPQATVEKPSKPVTKTVPRQTSTSTARPKPKPRPKKKPQSISKPIVSPKSKPLPAPVIGAVATAKITAPPQLMPKPIPVASPQATKPDSALIERAESDYMARLQAAIEERKNYPRRARRLRHQGSVLVSFSVQKNGVIKNLKVASSSDSKILDEAAMETVMLVSSVVPLPDVISRSEWTFTIPINYYLR